MMVKRNHLRIVFVILVCLLMISCTKKKEAIAYHEGFVSLQKDIGIKVVALINTFNARNPDEIEKAYSTLLSSADAALDKAQATEQFEDDKGLKAAVVELLTFYQSAFKKEYREMLDIVKNTNITTQSDAARLREIENEINMKEKPLDDKVRKAQDDLADEYGFKVAHRDAETFFGTSK